jgi:hypothetical protein
LIGNQAAFVGSGFVSEYARCDVPTNRDDYPVSVRLAKWQRLSANDVSLGVIARKDASATATFYVGMVTNSATNGFTASIWRWLAGTATRLALTAYPSTEGQRLTLWPIGTYLGLYLDGVLILAAVDGLIPSGRHGGILGYSQGGTGDTLLRLDDWRLGTAPARRVFAGAGALRRF